MNNALYLVSTPIGNLKDITLRALEVLEKVSLIACEDTRTTRILLNHYNLTNKTTSYNDINKTRKTPQIIKHIIEQGDVALVSDAGTPSISDPGLYLVREAIKNNISVIPIPGPSSILAALTASGSATDTFLFCGFLPRKKNKKKNKLQQLLNYDITVIIFESPQRIIDTLEVIKSLDQNRNLFMGREITKYYEEFLQGTAGFLIDHFKTKPKGEIVLIIKDK